MAGVQLHRRDTGHARHLNQTPTGPRRSITPEWSRASAGENSDPDPGDRSLARWLPSRRIRRSHRRAARCNSPAAPTWSVGAARPSRSTLIAACAGVPPAQAWRCRWSGTGSSMPKVSRSACSGWTARVPSMHAFRARDFRRTDGPQAIAAMTSWHINAVRLPLNEDCWLGINGAPARYSGARYRAAIRAYVARLNHAGLYVILDLHWSAPGGHGQPGNSRWQTLTMRRHSGRRWRELQGRPGRPLRALQRAEWHQLAVLARRLRPA